MAERVMTKLKNTFALVCLVIPEQFVRQVIQHFFFAKSLSNICGYNKQID
jgi:hypothetical protein